MLRISASYNQPSPKDPTYPPFQQSLFRSAAERRPLWPWAKELASCWMGSWASLSSSIEPRKPPWCWFNGDWYCRVVIYQLLSWCKMVSTLHIGIMVYICRNMRIISGFWQIFHGVRDISSCFQRSNMFWRSTPHWRKSAQTFLVCIINFWAGEKMLKRLNVPPQQRAESSSVAVSSLGLNSSGWNSP